MGAVDTTLAPDRLALLEEHGRLYARHGFAVAWTTTNTPEDAAKRVTTSKWQTTVPLRDEDFAAGMFKQRGQRKNPVVVVRPSGLVSLECDTQEDFERIQALGLPPTVTVQSSEPHKLHLHFRVPQSLERIPFAAFRFESGKVTADTERYFLLPPSVHPTGSVYSFLPGCGLDELEIAEMPASTYQALVEQAKQEDTELRERLSVEPGTKVKEGNRRQTVFRYACSQRRWTASREVIAGACHAYNAAMCEPPLSRERVDAQVSGAMKYDAGEELPRSVPSPEYPESRNNGRKPASLQGKVFPGAHRNASGITPVLALEKDILSRFAADLRLAGVAGEERISKLVYLALTSRMLPWGKSTERPVSLIARGTSSSGKSYLTQAVLRFFPEDACLTLGSMSTRYLFYTSESLSHRFIVVLEADGIAEDKEVMSALRSLLSEGKLIHGTVEGENKREGRKIEKDGPTGLLVTTTLASIDREMETRCLSLHTDDTPEQTRRVFQTLANLEDGYEQPVDFRQWQELQEWIAEQGEARTVIPFIKSFSRLMPITSPRLRRDFVTILSLIRAHAVLHQATRKWDKQGRIVATFDDYEAVRGLVGQLVAEGADAGVSPALRETVHAVKELLEDEGNEYATVKQIEGRLGIGQSSTYDRVNNALMKGYLVNTASRTERGKKIVTGHPLPGEEDFLPSAAAVRAEFRTHSEWASGIANPHEERDSEFIPAIPAIPADPRELTPTQRWMLDTQLDMENPNP